ncbi:nucleotidyl transferase AbiEii/AbiGii toxin family protein [Prosthecobacter sp. SYSU 5D2]|uniref:nucleotidyl transferase AbiEii/AbiGii toxin family protein n=1 Tax=Prosthecobacter sp. SYSU 5D2 TaxID=3134134 RepID=UPI0031FF00D1
MLHLAALPPDSLDLLRQLTKHPSLAQFSLVGGTSLALRFGHRRSVDLDFFTPESFDVETLAYALQQDVENFEVKGSNQIGFNAFVDDLKVDFVTYRQPLLEPPETVEGIRMFSLPDVIGMKLGAISNRGAKKDFYDLHALIEKLGVDALIEIYQRKYPKHDPMIVLRSMIYFDDAEEDVEPESLTHVSWEHIKEDLVKSVRDCAVLREHK